MGPGAAPLVTTNRRAHLVGSGLKAVEAHGGVDTVALGVESARVHELPQAVDGVGLRLVEIRIAEPVGQSQRSPYLDRPCVESRTLVDQIVNQALG